ncbi:hypothetical protein JY651_00215 [Pyxidicoccus parkwayensis]|uniref:Uncharacterized protein n=1 Tax=Pyxidicoccus parkwayensis TaxID=2813578 RepID=A0ABX7NXJ1_9BACT|nr:hypothetical protein [Pyxidicoccus parkwaysis]QSQ23448.1 hypothetical protein JY651_00215 [Pyxidicoccus parkwaysis]
MASLDDIREDYCDENLPVLLLLGLVSGLRRLDALLPAPGPVSEGPAPAREGPSGGERLPYLVLGLIALRERLLSALVPIRAEDPARPHGAHSGTSHAEVGLRELLR